MATPNKKYGFSDLVAASEKHVVTDEKVEKLMTRLAEAEKRFMEKDRERRIFFQDFLKEFKL